VTNEPVLIFGGCYGNLQATQALLAEAARRRIPPGRMICTGDVVAYRANPVETVALVRAAGLPEGYAAALETGLWPSVDVLSAAERAARVA